jgi:hypothetical protein
MIRRPSIAKLLFGCGLALLCAGAGVRACTIFVLTDGERTFFCNNEDWKDPNTRIWFIPAGDGYFGAAYVGFDNGWAQGGLNTEGLAYDWVAGFSEKWERDPALKAVRGNSSQRMLETCRTVDEAADFYRKHWEADFSRSRIMIADRTGASVIIGARDSKLFVERASQCRGFGYARETVNKRLAQPPKPSVANGMKILTECRQTGEFATKYSNVFDLRSGSIFFLQPGDKQEVELDLAAELKKGPHYYELPRLRAQLTQATMPLPARMQRFPMDTARPGKNEEPAITALLSQIVRDLLAGQIRKEDYSPELGAELLNNREQTQNDLQAFGDFVGLTFVERKGDRGDRVYRYRMDFSKATILQVFTLSNENIIVASESETLEWKVE